MAVDQKATSASWGDMAPVDPPLTATPTFSRLARFC